MAVTTRGVTAEEYFALGDELPRATELIDAEIVVTEPTARHQRLVGFVYVALSRWTAAGSGRGEAFLPLDIHLDNDNVFAPDVLWFSEAHVPQGDVPHIDAPPDLAVEVRSPSTWRFDIGVKKATYERAGLPELWLVDTRADTVLVYRRSSASAPTFDVALELGAGEHLTSPLLEGLGIDLAQLFGR